MHSLREDQRRLFKLSIDRWSCLLHPWHRQLGGGAVETTKYQNLLHRTEQTGLEESQNLSELDHQKTKKYCGESTRTGRKYNAARVKLNFFYVVLTGENSISLWILPMLLSLIRSSVAMLK